jgi:hypothetical protein
MKVSECCGEPPVDISYEIGICPACREHCEYEEIDEDE